MIELGSYYHVGDRYAHHFHYDSLIGKTVKVTGRSQPFSRDPYRSRGRVTAFATDSGYVVAEEDLLPLTQTNQTLSPFFLKDSL